MHPDERAGAAVVRSEVTASRLCHYTRSVVHIGDGTVQALTAVRAPKTNVTLRVPINASLSNVHSLLIIY